MIVDPDTATDTAGDFTVQVEIRLNPDSYRATFTRNEFDPHDIMEAATDTEAAKFVLSNLQQDGKPLTRGDIVRGFLNEWNIYDAFLDHVMRTATLDIDVNVSRR